MGRKISRSVGVDADWLEAWLRIRKGRWRGKEGEAGLAGGRAVKLL